MGLDDPFPDVIDPEAVAVGVEPLKYGAEGVQVGAEAVLAPLDDLDAAVLIAGVDDIAFRRDRVAEAHVFKLQDVGNRLPVVRVEATEPLPNFVDLGVAERVDRGCAVGQLLIPARAGDESTSLLGGDDGHRVGVAEHPSAARVSDGPFEEGEHEPGGAGDAGGYGWEAVFARFLGCGDFGGERHTGCSVDGDGSW